MSRRKLTAPTPKMRSDAIRALHDAVLDPETGDTARVSAARALARPSKAEADAEAEAAKPLVRSLLIMPMNHRDACIKAGIHESPHSITVDVDMSAPEGVKQGELDIAEARRRLAAGTPLAALAGPGKAGPMTNAERQRRWRDRRAERLAGA